MLLSGERAEAGDGFLSAVMRSVAAAMMVSLEDAVGMSTLVGNQVSVSLIRSALVLQIQTRKQR